MTTPTIEEVQLHASKTGLPPTEAEKFFYYYGANGWKVGKTPMVNWHMAMAGWRVRWEQCQEHAPVSPMDKMLMSKELDRVEARMKSISNSYAGHQEWDFKDRAEIKTLRARKSELLKALGMMI